MNNLILALLLFGLYYIASGYSSVGTREKVTRSGCVSALCRVETGLSWQEVGRKTSPIVSSTLTSSAREERAQPVTSPACSLSFEDRRQLEELINQEGL